MKPYLRFSFCLVLSFTPTLLRADCNCKQLETSKALKSADVVISGEIISLTTDADLNSLGVTTTGDTSTFFYKFSMLLMQRVYKVKVNKAFKGNNVPDTVTVIIPANGCGLNYELERGKKYVLYVTKEDRDMRTKELLKVSNMSRVSTRPGIYFTNQCLRITEEVNEEEKQILRLKK